jgi:hypothetical protein
MRTIIALAAAFGLFAAASSALAADTPSPPYPPLGLNLAGNSYWTTEHMFVDLMKSSSRWRAQCKDDKAFTWDNPLPKMDENGWPLEIGAEDAFLETYVVAAEQRDYLGNELIVFYEGKGRIEYALGWHLKSSAPGRDVVELGKGPLVLRISQTDPADHLRDIRVIQPEYESTYRTQVFRQEFLDRWRGFRAFRFMDWGATNGSKVRTWADRTRPTDRTQTQGGIALEYQIDLCNALKADGWFCIPHMADDDYVHHAARLIRDRLDPGLKAYIEYSNEVWNGIFEQSRYAQQKGKELGLGDPARPWEGGGMYYAIRSMQIFDIFQHEFGGRDRLVRVLAWQLNPWWFQNIILKTNDAHKHADAVAVAPYFGGNLDSVKTADQVAGWSVGQVLDACRKSVDERMAEVRQLAQLVRPMGLRVLAYEGGQHLVGTGGAENNQKLTDLFFAANRDPRMKQVYLDYLRAWKDAGGDLFMVFSSMGAPSKWGSWGILEHEGQDPTTAPKYQAVMEALRTDQTQTPAAATR